MDKILEHDGYRGSVQVSLEDECLYGKILFIADTVTYEAKTVPELEAAFREAVTDYVHTCKEIGKEPLKPCKGSFNVRISPELHRQAATLAQRSGITLNDLVNKSIDQYVNKPEVKQVIEHHHYPRQPLTGYFEETGETNWTPKSNIKMSACH